MQNRLKHALAIMLGAEYRPTPGQRSLSSLAVILLLALKILAVAAIGALLMSRQ